MVNFAISAQYKAVTKRGHVVAATWLVPQHCPSLQSAAVLLRTARTQEMFLRFFRNIYVVDTILCPPQITLFMTMITTSVSNMLLPQLSSFNLLGPIKRDQSFSYQYLIKTDYQLVVWLSALKLMQSRPASLFDVDYMINFAKQLFSGQEKRWIGNVRAPVHSQNVVRLNFWKQRRLTTFCIWSITLKLRACTC